MLKIEELREYIAENITYCIEEQKKYCEYNRQYILLAGQLDAYREIVSLLNIMEAT